MRVWSAIGLGVVVLAGSVALGEPEATPDTPAASATPEVKAEPGSFVTLEDGSLVIAGTIKVPGKGTAESPYIVDWSALTSAHRVYDPRKGKKDLPAWVGALNGKRVRLTGYLLLPLTGSGTDELLIMQNQWDGCCIGVPPTPYDAVEVRMRRPLDTSRGAPGFGSLEGKFKVEPYIVSDWLLGLYLLEDAEMVRGVGGDGS
ncbi:MAG: hypothetical protein R3B49_07740 [Phycisphaerales bacterium]